MAGGLVNISARPRNFACVQLPAPGDIISVNLSCMSVAADGAGALECAVAGEQRVERGSSRGSRAPIISPSRSFVGVSFIEWTAR